MKRLIIGQLLLLSLSATASVIETTDVASYVSESDVRASKCFYETALINYQNGDSVYKVFLNSDEDSDINFALELDPSQVPLKNGIIESKYSDVEIAYKNGVLSYTFTEKDGLVKQEESISILVGPDLQSPREALGEETLSGPTRSFPFYAKDKVLKKLHCKF